MAENLNNSKQYSASFDLSHFVYSDSEWNRRVKGIKNSMLSEIIGSDDVVVDLDKFDINDIEKLISESAIVCREMPRFFFLATPKNVTPEMVEKIVTIKKYVDDNKLNFGTEFIVSYSSSGITVKKDVENLLAVDEILKNNGITIKVTENDKNVAWTVDKVANANSKLEKWAEEINSARLDGKKLSPMEKYMYAYKIVSRFYYKDEALSDDPSVSRTLLGVLNTDKIVCVGYATLLSTLCEMIGIECKPQTVASMGKTPDHCSCCVRMEDEKYGVSGFYYSDPCWDGLSEFSEKQGLDYFLIGYDELKDYMATVKVTLDGVSKVVDKNSQPDTEIDNSALLSRFGGNVYDRKSFINRLSRERRVYKASNTNQFDVFSILGRAKKAENDKKYAGTPETKEQRLEKVKNVIEMMLSTDMRDNKLDLNKISKSDFTKNVFIDPVISEKNKKTLFEMFDDEVIADAIGIIQTVIRLRGEYNLSTGKVKFNSENATKFMFPTRVSDMVNINKVGKKIDALISQRENSSEREM